MSDQAISRGRFADSTERPLWLALTSLRGFQDDPGTTLLAGPWCVTKENASRFSVHPYPLNGKAEWLKACEVAETTYQDVLPKISTWCDSHHEENLGQDYWEQVLGWFLRYFVDTVVERYSVLSSIEVEWPDIKVIGLNSAQFSRPANARNFLDSIRSSDEANLQLSTQIAGLMGFAMESRSLAGLAPFAQSSDEESPPKEPRAFGLGRQIWTPPLGSDVYLYKTLMRRRTLAMLAVMTGFKASDIAEFPQNELSCPIDELARSALAKLPAERELDRIVLALLAHNMPTCLLEQWRDMAISSRTWISKKRPVAIVTGLGGFWSPQFAVWSAECKRRGTQLIGLQHGGTYGERDLSTSERHERQLADRYITWGWREGDKTVALPAARLAGLPKFDSVSKGPILWVGTSDSRYVYQLGPRPVGSQFRDYFKSQTRFAEELNPEVAKDILFRPYPSNFDWPDQPGINLKVPVRVDDFSKEFWERLRECRLVVVDHPGSTTFLETLTIGRPAICFGSSEHFDIRDPAKPYYEALANVGVYHESPETVAALLGEIRHDVRAWWADTRRQEAVADFRRNFASTEGFFWQWRRFLLNARKIDRAASLPAKYSGNN